MADKISQLLGQGNHRPVTRFPWPGPDGKSVEEGGKGIQACLWSLGKDELDRAMVEAHKYFFKTLVLHRDDLNIPEIYASWQSEIKVQQLFLALRDPDDPVKPFAASVTKVRQLDTDVQQYLFNRLVDHMNKRSPIRVLKTIEELDEVLVELGKASDGATQWLSSLDSASLRSIITELAVRLLRLMKANYSDTSSSNDSTGTISIEIEDEPVSESTDPTS